MLKTNTNAKNKQRMLKTNINAGGSCTAEVEFEFST